MTSAAVRLALLAAAASLACGGSGGVEEAADGGVTPPIDAGEIWLLPVGGGPLGSAEPVAEPAPIDREYASPGELVPVPDRTRAPGFPDVAGWLNVTRSFHGSDLAGRVLLVDFWTAGCANCIHMVPRLEQVSHEFASDPVLVLGAHSQKFTEEKSVDSLQKAMAILQITHPIALDVDHGAWEAWGVNAWPTLFLVDATGHIAKKWVGEKSYESLRDAVETALAEARPLGVLSREPLGFLGLERDDPHPLSHPEGVAATADGFAISDTGHHRIVFVDSTGKLLDVVGDGTAGSVEGGYSTARFSSPRGMVANGNDVYVADTGNHSVRVVRRGSRQVDTIAGTGSRGSSLLAEGDAESTSIASPWDVERIGGRLFVALAGSHQIAELLLETSRITPVAGSGKEGLADGPGLEAWLAQPSGLGTDGTDLFFTDAESSSVRRLALGDGSVTTLVGNGLWKWGDQDGPADAALLQHPQGAAFGAGALFIADTYNSKVKRVDPVTGETITIAGTGSHADLFEPGGVVFTDAGAGALLVADTGNDRVLIVPVDGASPELWPIEGLTAP